MRSIFKSVIILLCPAAAISIAGKVHFIPEVEEIELARKYGKPILLIGQTIGPFSGTYQEIFYSNN